MSLYDFTFEYNIPKTVDIDDKLINTTLKKIQIAMRSGVINGGESKLDMGRVCDLKEQIGKNKCKTVACIGGWLGVYLLGHEDNDSIHSLFDRLAQNSSRLHALFNDYQGDANNPLVAARAIQNYLNGNDEGEIWCDKSGEDLRPMQPLSAPAYRKKAKARAAGKAKGKAKKRRA